MNLIGNKCLLVSIKMDKNPFYLQMSIFWQEFRRIESLDGVLITTFLDGAFSQCVGIVLWAFSRTSLTTWIEVITGFSIPSVKCSDTLTEHRQHQEQADILTALQEDDHFCFCMFRSIVLKVRVIWTQHP